MGKMSRAKGGVGEREVVKFFKKFGIELFRTANSGAVQKWGGHPGDLMGLEGWHIEVKRQEANGLFSWIKQAEEECREGDKPIVIFRRSHDKWRVVIELEDFINLIKDEASARPSRPGEEVNPPS